MVSIATWNINSVRLRMDQVARVLTEQAPDVLCLQEIKTAEEFFPHAAFEQLGYVHRAVGVAGLLEHVVREQVLGALDLLHTKHVGRLLRQEALDLGAAQADGVDVPGGD